MCAVGLAGAMKSGPQIARERSIPMKLRSTLAAAAILLLLSSCQNVERTGTVKRVTITKSSQPDGTPSVSMDPVELSIKENEEVEWKSAGGEDFVVTLKKTPFEKHSFHEGRGKSGPIKVREKKTYKYTVFIDGQELDPSVIIKD
jgi:hypothetical protein